MVDVAGALASISTSIAILKSLREIDADYDSATYKLQIADLATNLAEAKLLVVDMKDEIEAKDSEIDRLKAFDGNLDNLKIVNGFYYGVDADGSPQGFPYCTYCIDKKRGLFRLIRKADSVRGSCFCPECNTPYVKVSEYPWSSN